MAAKWKPYHATWEKITRKGVVVTESADEDACILVGHACTWAVSEAQAKRKLADALKARYGTDVFIVAFDAHLDWDSAIVLRFAANRRKTKVPGSTLAETSSPKTQPITRQLSMFHREA